MQHTHVSPGLWALAWRRLRADRVAMVALAVVAAFLLMLVLSASGVIVADWEDEVGVNYAPPTFLGADAGIVMQPAAGAASVATPVNVFDPLADDMRALKTQQASSPQ